MPWTVKVVVNPNRTIEDSNIDLVKRGFPTLPRDEGHGIQSEPTGHFRDVSIVVTFELLYDNITSAQKAFLHHLRGSLGVVKSYEVYDPLGKRVEL